MVEPYRVVRFDGAVDVSRYPEYRSAFEAVPGDVPVIVDLRDAEHVDSTFLSELLLLRRRHRAPLAVVIAPGNVGRMFEIVNFRSKMEIVPDLPSAVAFVSSAHAAPERSLSD